MLNNSASLHVKCDTELPVYRCYMTVKVRGISYNKAKLIFYNLKKRTVVHIGNSCILKLRRC